MTRIVAGQARGRQLQVPGRGVRPTSDRVREALFSTLEGLLELAGARVLDLFAGTGAVGLEALSRGAGAITLVDSGREAALALRRNVDVLGLPGAVIRQQPAAVYLAGTASDGPFDLVFADPPYGFGQPELTSVLELVVARTAPEAVIVVERAARDLPPPWPTMVEPIKDRRYGDTVLWYGRREVAGTSPRTVT